MPAACVGVRRPDRDDGTAARGVQTAGGGIGGAAAGDAGRARSVTCGRGEGPPPNVANDDDDADAGAGGSGGGGGYTNAGERRGGTAVDGAPNATCADDAMPLDGVGGMNGAPENAESGCGAGACAWTCGGAAGVPTAPGVPAPGTQAARCGGNGGCSGCDCCGGNGGCT